MEQPDPEVVVAGSGGFEVFYREARAGALAVVMALRGPRAGVEESVQEAFARAYDRWDQVSAMDRPDLWVHRVALNIASSRLRRLAAEARALARVAGRRTHQPRPVEDLDDDFWRLVRGLPRRQAQAVALRYAADLAVADIAQVMVCAEGTVKAHLHAARRQLATELTGGEA